MIRKIVAMCHSLSIMCKLPDNLFIITVSFTHINHQKFENHRNSCKIQISLCKLQMLYIWYNFYFMSTAEGKTKYYAVAVVNQIYSLLLEQFVMISLVLLKLQKHTRERNQQNAIKCVH